MYPRDRLGDGCVPALCGVPTADPPARDAGSAPASPPFSAADRGSCVWGHLPAISSRCRRSSVAGVTKKLLQLCLGSRRDRAASRARSAGSNLGSPSRRWSTASCCRSTSSSTSLAALPGSRRPAGSSDPRVSGQIHEHRMDLDHAPVHHRPAEKRPDQGPELGFSRGTGTLGRPDATGPRPLPFGALLLSAARASRRLSVPWHGRMMGTKAASAGTGRPSSHLSPVSVRNADSYGHEVSAAVRCLPE